MSVEYLDEWREKLESISKSRSQSKQSTTSGSHGRTRIDPDDEELAPLVPIYVTLLRARTKPFSTKSNYARMAADFVAICASEGLISTRLEHETYGNQWLITELGLEWMRDFDDTFIIGH